MPEENASVKIGSGISVDKSAENIFKLVDGTMTKNFETFILFENIEKNNRIIVRFKKNLLFSEYS